jgi:mRNA interferase MazF
MRIKRNDVVLVGFDPTVGHEIQKVRPAIVVSNDIANEFSNFVTVVPLTSKKLDRITRIEVPIGRLDGLDKKSKVLVDQIRSIDKRRIRKVIARIPGELMAEIDERLKLQLALS